MTVPAGLISNLVGSSGLTLNLIVSSNATNLNLRTMALTAGWDGAAPLNLTVTINAGVSVTSTTASEPAIKTDSFPVGTIVKLVNYGSILGKGGNGGTINSGVGQPGGVGVLATYSISIDNQGTINAGSGGNGGNGASYYPVLTGGTSYCPSDGSANAGSYYCGVSANGAAGANGGSTGVAGATGASGGGGTAGDRVGCPGYFPSCGGAAGGAGGARGAYISGNTFVIWLNNGTRNGAVI